MGYWGFACYRLLGLLINLRLKRRLYCVQATYILVPVCLLLLRLTLLLYDARWDTGRRVMRDMELLLVLGACAVAVRFVIFRPVREMARANAPLAGFDGDDGDRRRRVKGRLKGRTTRAVGKVKPASNRSSSHHGAAQVHIREPSWDLCPPVERCSSEPSDQRQRHSEMRGEVHASL